MGCHWRVASAAESTGKMPVAPSAGGTAWGVFEPLIFPASSASRKFNDSRQLRKQWHTPVE